MLVNDGINHKFFCLEFQMVAVYLQFFGLTIYATDFLDLENIEYISF